MADAPETNWLDVLRSALWPLLALIALVEFHGPATKILDKVGQGDAEEFDAGPVKIKFSPEGLRRIPAPSSAVAGVLAKLNPGEVEALVTQAPLESIPICRPDALKIQSPSSQQKAAVYDKLSGLGLVAFDPPRPDNGNANWCRVDGLQMAHLTDAGASVRTYLLTVMTSSISISPS